MRLIDADALPKYTGTTVSAFDIAITVEKAPEIVVRCKDCKWAYLDESHFICGYRGFFVSDSFFCADGKRKDGADDGNS